MRQFLLTAYKIEGDTIRFRRKSARQRAANMLQCKMQVKLNCLFVPLLTMDRKNRPVWNQIFKCLPFAYLLALSEVKKNEE